MPYQVKLWLGSFTFLSNIKNQKKWKVIFSPCPTNRRKGEKNSPGNSSAV